MNLLCFGKSHNESQKTIFFLRKMKKFLYQWGKIKLLFPS